MTFEGLHNQNIYAEEHQPQVTLAKNCKNCKKKEALVGDEKPTIR